MFNWSADVFNQSADVFSRSADVYQAECGCVQPGVLMCMSA